MNHLVPRLAALLILIGSFSPLSLSGANLDSLDYLYSPRLDEKNQLLLDRINNHARNTEFDYALALTERLFNQIDGLNEESPATFGQILVNVGIIHSANENYDEGLQYIDRGLEFMELRINPFSKKLINGVMAKALTEFSREDLEAAEDSFRRAQHITHRQGGVYSEDQLTMMNYLTKTHLKQGKARLADNDQIFTLRVAEKVHGPDAIEILPVLDRLGGYFATRGSTIPPIVTDELRLHRDSLFKMAVSMYQRSVDIIEQNYGDNDLRLVQPLRGLASARMLQITNRKYAEAALERSLEIVESNPESDATDRAQALIDLADLYVITADRRASETYLEAWHLLQEREETIVLAHNLFGTPTRLFPRESNILFLDRWPDAASPDTPLFVSIEYNVTTAGTVNRVKVLDKNVPNEQVRMMRQLVRSSKFRPRITEGEIVATDGMTLYQPFKVLRSPPARFEEQPPEAEAGTGDSDESIDDSAFADDEVS